MTGQRLTRELLATLRPGDVVELHSPSLSIRGTLTPALLISGAAQPNSLALGDGSWGPSISYDGNPIGWVQMLELTVVSRASRLYENSTRQHPVVGDVVRDGGGDVWHLTDENCWRMAWPSGPDGGHPLAYVQSFAPLVLLWDGVYGGLPAAES